MKTYTYKINSDAYLTKVEASNMDEAARKLAATEPHLAKQGIETVQDLLSYIESVDGAWLWIESQDAPDGNRLYAGQENM